MQSHASLRSIIRRSTRAITSPPHRRRRTQHRPPAAASRPLLRARTAILRSGIIACARAEDKAIVHQSFPRYARYLFEWRHSVAGIACDRARQHHCGELLDAMCRVFYLLWCVRGLLGVSIKHLIMPQGIDHQSLLVESS